MTDLLQQAIENLEIRDVYQRSIVANCASGFEPKYHDSDELQLQFMHMVRRTEILELENEEDSKKIFRVILALGVRWIEAIEEQESEVDAEEEIEPVELAKIEGRMLAEYLIKDEIPQEALEEFAKRNASYHVWPYWREIVSSQCQKMHLPRVTLPTIQVASNRNATAVATSKDSDA